jgi:hypothetical protein
MNRLWALLLLSVAIVGCSSLLMDNDTAVSISAIAAYGSSRAGRPFPTLGVTKLTVLACPRSVSGIPAPVGTPIALLTPGTTSQGTPAR